MSAHQDDDHDLDQGFRDALALLTATDAEDAETRQAISRDACCACLKEALIAMLLACIDEGWGGDIKAFTHTAMKELEL